MPDELAWNGDLFRRRMKRQAEQALRYADEHNRRLKRKQPNGNRVVHDEHVGISSVCDFLSVSSAADRPSALLRELNELEAEDFIDQTIVDQAAFRRGFQAKVEEIRTRISSSLK